MSESKGGGGDNSKAAAAPAVSTTPKPAMPEPAAPAPVTVPKPVVPEAKPVTFMHRMQVSQSLQPQANTVDASQGQDSTSQEEATSPEAEPSEKKKEGDDFIKKFIEYLMKLIQSQLEEEQKRNQGGGGLLVPTVELQELSQPSQEKRQSSAPRPSPPRSSNNTPEELDKLFASLGVDDVKKFQGVLKNLGVAFSDDKKITDAQRQNAQKELKGAIGEELLGNINNAAKADPKFGQNLGQFAQKLGNFLENPSITNGIGVLSSGLKIANPLAKAVLGGEALGQQSGDAKNAKQNAKKDANQDDSTDQLADEKPQDPSGTTTPTPRKSPFKIPSSRDKPRPSSSGSSK